MFGHLRLISSKPPGATTSSHSILSVQLGVGRVMFPAPIACLCSSNPIVNREGREQVQRSTPTCQALTRIIRRRLARPVAVDPATDREHDTSERKELAMPDHQSFSRVNTQGNQLARALGRRLRYLRAQTGLTQLELGRRASMDRAYISRLERGRILPRYVALVRLAGSLGVSVADLVRHAPCSIDRVNVADTTRS